MNKNIIHEIDKKVNFSLNPFCLLLIIQDKLNI